MSRDEDQQGISSQAEPPRDFANVPAPRDLYPTSDIRFVLIELGRISERIEALVRKVDCVGDRLGKVETAIDRVKTGLIVGAAIFSIVGALFWWALGDRITVAVRSALTPPVIEQSAHGNKH